MEQRGHQSTPSDAYYSPRSGSTVSHGRPGSLQWDTLSETARGKQPELDAPHDTDETDDHDESDEEGTGLLRGAVQPQQTDDEATPRQVSTKAGSPLAKGISPAASAARYKGGKSTKMTQQDKTAFWREMWAETLPILLLSLAGSIFTGMLLEKLEQWGVFIRIEELFILVPILLNLKGNALLNVLNATPSHNLHRLLHQGNLEMNLAARFSTSANIGELDLRLTRRALVLGNMALLQVQALIVSLISGLIAFILGMLARNGVHHSLQHPLHSPGSPLNDAAGGVQVTDTLRGGYFEALMILCVSMLATSISSAVLGTFMCALVVVCRRFKINPDNIATPLASSLGDLVTLVILGVLSSLFASFMGTLVSTAVFLLLLFAIVVNLIVTFRNAYVQELLTVGWGPLFVAMAISSATGLILERYVHEFRGFALFAPVFTSITGNSASVFVSRISTALHSSRREHYWVVSTALFAVTAPVLVLFLGFAWITGQAEVTLVFVLVFVVVTCVQLAFALGAGYYLALLLWRLDYDPDVYALPLLSSLLDVTGQLLLVVAFSIARKAAGAVVGSSEALDGVPIPQSLGEL